MSKRFSLTVAEQIGSLFAKIQERASIQVSFNPIWFDKDGHISGLVTHPTQRLILKQGEIYKTMDAFERPALIIGTHYGSLVLFRQSHASEKSVKWVYEVSPMLVKKGFFVGLSGLLQLSTIEHVESGVFHNLVELEYQEDIQKGNKVWDGIPLPEKKTFVAKEKKLPHASKNKPPVQKNKKPSNDKHKKAPILSVKVVQEPQHSLIETCQSNFDEGDIIYDPLLQKNLVRRSNKWVVEEEKVEA